MAWIEQPLIGTTVLNKEVLTQPDENSHLPNLLCYFGDMKHLLFPSRALVFSPDENTEYNPNSETYWL